MLFISMYKAYAFFQSFFSNAASASFFKDFNLSDNRLASASCARLFCSSCALICWVQSSIFELRSLIIMEAFFAFGGINSFAWLKVLMAE